jgi:hypothetical protein
MIMNEDWNQRYIDKNAPWDSGVPSENLSERTMRGVGRTTESEAWEIFEDFLDDAYTSYLEGRLGGMYGKRGRPAKHRAPIHCEVQPETRDELKRLSSQLACSQGETIDYLVAFFDAAQRTKSVKNVAAKVGARGARKTAAVSAGKKTSARGRG